MVAADGRHLVTVDDGVAQTHALTGPPPGPPAGVGAHGPVALSANRRLLAAAGNRATLAGLDDTGTPTATAVLPPDPHGSVRAVALRGDGKLLATGDANGTLYLWDTSTPTAPRPIGPPLTGYRRQVDDIAFSPDGTTLVAVSTGVSYRGRGVRPADADDRGVVLLWNVANPARATPRGDPLTGHEGAVDAVAISPDGRTLAYGGTDRKIHLLDVTDPARPA